MKTTPLLLFIPLLMTSGALAAGQDDFNVQTASSRMVKHEDGSRSYFAAYISNHFRHKLFHFKMNFIRPNVKKRIFE